MIDRDELLPTSTPRPLKPNDVFVMLQLAFESVGLRRALYLRKALCAIAVFVGIDVFTVAMRDTADDLLNVEPPHS